MDVQLVEENEDLNRIPLAILLDVEEKMYLADVRDLIAEQVSDVMPPGNYNFIFRGATVSKAMEEELTLKQIVEESNDASLCVVLLSIDLPGDENKEYSHDQGCLVEQEKVPQDLSPVSSQSTDYKTSLPATSLPENPKNVFQLRSPTTCEFRNLKIYTDAEIKKGRGQEQAYRTF